MELHNPFALTGKTILVTGASSGIGRSIAVEATGSGATFSFFPKVIHNVTPNANTHTAATTATQRTILIRPECPLHS